MDPRDELIGITEAARLLGVNPSTVTSWINQGRIPAVQYGPHGIYRVRRGDVLAYIEASRLASRGHGAEEDAGAGLRHGAG